MQPQVLVNSSTTLGMAARRRSVVCKALAALAVAGLLVMLVACDFSGTSGKTYSAPGTPMFAATPSSAAASENPAADLYYAQKTQDAAAVVLTSVAGRATQAAQATDSVVRLTQEVLNLQLTSGAATATEARACTQDAQTAAAATSTQARAYAQDMATAQAATEARAAGLLRETAAANATQIEVAHAATATAVQAGINAQTQAVTTWGPIIFIILLAGSALFFAWRLMGIFEATRRVIPQPNGAPLIITEQRASLEEHLPNFLRWLAWFLETRQVIVDQEKNMYPVTVLHGGRAESPKLTDDDRQERVARRRQFTQAVAAMAGGGGEGVVHEAQTLAAGQDPVSLPVSEGGQVADGEYRIVEPAQLSGWLAEVRAQLPEDDGVLSQAK